MMPAKACPKSPTTGSSYIIRSEEGCRAATQATQGSGGAGGETVPFSRSYKGGPESFPGCHLKGKTNDVVFNTNTNAGRYGLNQPSKMSLCYFNKGKERFVLF